MKKAPENLEFWPDLRPDAIMLMEPGARARLRAAASGGAGMPAGAFQRRVPPEDPEDVGYETTPKGVAIIRFEGMVCKRTSFWGWLFGGVAACEQTQEALQNAIADSNVKSVLFVVDSPGGCIPGVSELAAAIFDARSVKPVNVFASDMMASAAYWIGSQGTKVYTNATSSVGFVGVVCEYVDYSRLEKNVGIENEVFVSTPLKGTGREGPLTEEQRAEVQGQIDAIAALFTADIARGRGIPMAKAQAMADARIHIGADAVRAGFVDGVTTLAALLGEMEAEEPTIPAANLSIDVTPCEDDDDDMPGMKKKYGSTSTARARGHESQASPSPAKSAKEHDMKVSPETLKLLGLASGATEEEFETALQTHLKAGASASTAGAGTQGEPSPVASMADVKALNDQIAKLSRNLEEHATNTDKIVSAELQKRLDAIETERRTKAMVAEAMTARKVTSKQREAAEKLAAKAPEEFKAFLADAAVTIPTAKVFEGGREKEAFDESIELRPGALAGLNPRDPDEAAQIANSAKAFMAANPARKLTFQQAVNELCRAQ
ncbi:MAG: hypothetical protein EPN91_02120 [Salinibacterium sp.]|nr:MAG: hypothetical protein EPN91_02120 [Salinibacterium sp.]